MSYLTIYAEMFHSLTFIFNYLAQRRNDFFGAFKIKKLFSYFLCEIDVKLIINIIENTSFRTALLELI